MSRRAAAATAALLRRLCREPDLHLVMSAGGFTLSDGGVPSISRRGIRLLIARGLLVEREPGRYAAAREAHRWLARQESADAPFRVQHGDVAASSHAERSEPGLVNLAESPVAALSRRSGPGGKPWLQPHLAAAAERLRRDFEVGQLQPRVTSNWSAAINTGRRTGDGAGLADLTDTALVARLRFDRAMRAVGPELSGVLIDLCCFVKGLETVERERQWPARSAKLVLRIALESLARHYGLAADATAAPAAARTRHWGSSGYRPEIG